MKLTFFELCQARSWAMSVLNSFVDVRIVLDASDVDKTGRWFLVQDIPQRHGGVQLSNWDAMQQKEEEHLLEFSNRKRMNLNFNCTTVHIRAFVQTFTESSSMYVGLYDETGARFIDACLVVWNRTHPEVTNQGYAPGRCPDRIDL